MADPAVMPRGYLQLGTHEFGPGAPSAAARCVVKITPKSKGKVDKKNAQGKDDAKTTWQGMEPADLEIEIAWNSADAEADQAIEDRLADLSPRGPARGKSLTIAAKRLRIHAIDAVIVEEMDGPNDVPGTTQVTCKIKTASISKSAQAGQAGQGDANTPTAPTKSDGTPAATTGKGWVDPNAPKTGGNANPNKKFDETPTVMP